MFSQHDMKELSGVFELLPDAFLIADHDGRIVHANLRAKALLDRHSDLTAWNERWFALVHPEEQRIGLEAWERALAEPGQWHRLLAKLHLDESRSLLEWRIFSPDENARELVITIRDLRDPFAALSARKQSLQRLYEETPIMAHAIDRRGRLVMVSEKWLERLGYAREEVIGRPSTDFLTEESRAYAAEILEDYFREGMCRDVPYQMVTKQGEIFDVELSATSEVDAQGNFARSFAVLVEVTERNALVQRLSQNNHLLEAVFEAIPDALVVADLDRSVVRVNSATLGMFDYQEHELIGAKTRTFYAREEDFLAAGRAVFNRQDERTSPLVVTINCKRKDGHVFPAQLIGAVVFDQEGEKSGFLGLLRDVTEEFADRNELLIQQRELEQSNKELRQANKDLERFAYISSHDLQEPLRKIASFISLLEAHLGDDLDETGQLYFDYVRDGATRMSELIRALLAYSRTNDVPDLEPCNALDALDDALGNLEEMLDHALVTITPPEVPPYVYSHGPLLAQIFSNLISNSIKYAHPERPLELVFSFARHEGGCLKCCVKDNGIGIEPKHHERVFGIFQRLHRRDQVKGQGIGLAMCKRIIERQGGTLTLDSDGHSGSTFCFTLRRSNVPL